MRPKGDSSSPDNIDRELEDWEPLRCEAPFDIEYKKNFFIVFQVTFVTSYPMINEPEVKFRQIDISKSVKQFSGIIILLLFVCRH